MKSTSKGRPTLIRGEQRICPNCGQYQHKGIADFYDCVNDCVKRGFANKVYYKEEYTRKWHDPEDMPKGKHTQ